MTWRVQLMASVERPESDADTARLLRGWFTGAFESMGGALREKLLAVQPLAADVAKSWAGNGPYGPESGGVWSHVTTRVRGPRGLKERGKPFTDNSWPAFLQGLDEVPHQSEFMVRALGADCYPGGSMLWVTARFNEESDPKFRQYDGRWLFLNVSFSPELLDDPEYQKSVLTFARGIADQVHLAYAEVSYDRENGRTTFENVFRGMPKRTALESRCTLRGYAWLTVMPQEIGDRLGGAGRSGRAAPSPRWTSWPAVVTGCSPPRTTGTSTRRPPSGSSVSSPRCCDPVSRCRSSRATRRTPCPAATRPTFKDDIRWVTSDGS